jgi:hypothetical protein
MNILLHISHRQRRRIAMVARQPVEPSSEKSDHAWNGRAFRGLFP